MDKRRNKQASIIHLCSSSVGAANLFSVLAYALSTFDKIKKENKEENQVPARRKVEFYKNIGYIIPIFTDWTNFSSGEKEVSREKERIVGVEMDARPLQKHHPRFRSVFSKWITRVRNAYVHHTITIVYSCCLPYVLERVKYAASAR